MWRSIWRFGSLRLRIGVLYALLFAAVLAAVMTIVDAGIERFGEDAASRDLAANARVFDEILGLRARQMSGSAAVLASDFGFREAFATQDRPTIASALRSLKHRSGAGGAFAVGLDGTLIGDGASPNFDVATIWGALDAGEDQGIIRLGDTLALAAASPIEAPDLLGWLVVAQPLDATEMERLAALGAVEMNATISARSDLPDWAANAEPGEVVEGPEDEPVLHHFSRLATLQEGLSPRLALAHPLGEALSRYATLRYQLAAIALAGLALIIALGFRISGSITGPLGRLDAAVRAFARGEELSLEVRTDDEVGRLSSSFKAMVGAIEERERQIVHVGLHDGLTGLPNRKLFVEQLSRALARRRTGERLLVAYVDLDDFKVVNDTLGHPAGDALLRHTAKDLTRCLPDAQIARLGGDEFAILIDGIDPSANLAAIADNMQSCFGRPITIDGVTAETSASVGIAIAPGDGEDGVTLMKHADLALYRSKREGKAGHHFFEPALDEQARMRREMELDLRLAIRDGGFELYFQPLYNLRDDCLQGFEALIRWPHPRRGMISPAEFIPLAEETGLIVQIGEWVLREACRIATRWPENLTVAVNISPRQFAAPGLSSTILQALGQSGLAPNRLELEITESVFIANIEKTLSALHGLRDLGVKIALDDFGTGYSSLSYLRSFPFDKVKIDRSFVRDLTEEGNAHAVIRAITTLAEALGMATLAEGVELPEQCEILRREGCQFIQGYLLSEPVEEHRLAGLIGDYAEIERSALRA
ncbi:putative bifunctional diguanylate cyclase/phosphodiesterase [Qipengyuania spongiae]|uniref:EAL domain-containing protein n=1 Tax=Qipengyuania spongiae TaxID=2909673 RepID=A0ABY5T0H0_9SPHN|nr:EAL domain-containing protein [Qipengyuania spongiae]UVI40273.1 EAL domain-containing protein [Qipengyuania spongiae]